MPAAAHRNTNAQLKPGSAPRGRPASPRPLPTRRYYIRHMRDDLIHRVKILAAQRRETMETIFNRALEHGLDALESEQ